MPKKDPFDGIHMHDVHGDIMDGADMVSALKAMDSPVTFGDDMVAVGDSAKLIIPRSMTPRQAVTAIMSHWLNQQQSTTFTKTFRYRPYDGAHAAYRQLKNNFGFVDGKATESFFGSTPPQMVTVHTGLNDSTSVPWGELRVAALADAVITFGEGKDDVLGPVFRMGVTAPRSQEHTIEMLFAAIEMDLKESSIYRGKVIKAGGGTEPRYVDVTNFDSQLVIYASDVERVLKANLWLPLQRTEELRQKGIPLKQGVLAHGKFGTGKTLAGLLTARIAVENGWTAILAESGDDLQEVLELAAMYGPAFVFVEDVDNVASADSDDIEEMLEAFDGVVAKGRDILLLATTNNVELLHAGMMRPGRFDVVVEIGMLDRDGITRMIRGHVDAASLEEDIDFGEIAGAMQDFPPAFVAQVIDRARKYALLDDTRRLDTRHFVDAAVEMQGHLALMKTAGTKPEKPSLDSALSRQVTSTLADFVVEIPGHGPGRLIHAPENGSRSQG